MKLQNRVAIVTGAGRGIGKATAFAFSKEGAKVVVNDVAVQCMEEVAAHIKNAGSVAIGMRCDVTNPEETKEMVNACLNKFGQIDILVNGAGAGDAGGDVGDRFLKEGVAREVWEPMFDLTLKGTFHCTMSVLPHMISRKYGKVINIASQAGRYGSEFAGPYYAAQNGGKLAFTRQVAFKVGAYGINVNAVAHGVILMPGTQKMWLERSEEDRQERLGKIPLRRLGTPEEIANVVLFLASDESSYITGATIDANGGRFMS